MAETIIIGDVHGCYRELMDLLDKIGPSSSDKVYFVGDLITKGPSNREVLDFLIEQKQMQTVLGNHENALLMKYRSQPVVLKRSQKKTRKELGRKFNSYMKFVAKWPLMIKLPGDGLIVHAGIRPDISLNKQTAEDCTNIRTVNGVPWFEKYKGKKTIVFGHWVTERPIIRKNVIGLDTGCVYGGKLTALLWEKQKFVSVPARHDYNNSN